MIEIRRNLEEEKEQLIDCANQAFADSVPEGFQALLPKLYGEDAKAPGNHLLALEDGKILGLVLAQPLRYQAHDEELDMIGIGTVSVLPEARGRGIMKALMQRAVEEMKKEHCALACLSGQRQRYAYWGFEPGGVQTKYRWNEANLRHAYKEEDPGEVSIQPMEKDLDSVSLRPAEKVSDSVSLRPMEKDSNYVKQAWEMWEEQPAHMSRPFAQFYNILCSWGRRPFVCLMDGKMIGYLALSADQEIQISEFVLKKEYPIRLVLQALKREFGTGRGTVTLGMQEQTRMQEFEAVCESEDLASEEKYLILDWYRVLQVLFRMKNRIRPLADGRVRLRIIGREGEDTFLSIEVNDGQVELKRLHEGEADLEITEKKASRIFFRYSAVAYPELRRMPAGWFPLPLSVSEQDRC